MIGVSKIETLRKANKDVSYDLSDTKFKGLTPVEKNIYIILMQFENAFYEYDLKELAYFSNLNKEQIIETIKNLDDQNILDKNELNLKEGEVL